MFVQFFNVFHPGQGLLFRRTKRREREIVKKFVCMALSCLVRHLFFFLSVTNDGHPEADGMVHVKCQLCNW